MKFLILALGLFSGAAFAVGPVFPSHDLICKYDSGHDSFSTHMEYDFRFSSLQSTQFLMRMGLGVQLDRDVCWADAELPVRGLNPNTYEITGTLNCFDGSKMPITMTFDLAGLTLTDSLDTTRAFACTFQDE